MSISIHHLDVSAEVFRQATRAIERHSVEIGRFASINDVVRHAAERALSDVIPVDLIDAALAQELDGQIRISLIVRASWRPILRAVQEQLQQRSGRRLSIKQTVAILLG